MRTKKENKNIKGQATTEAILIISILVTVIYLISAQFKSNEVFANIVSGPWQALSGIIQNGTWKPPNESMQLHPNNSQTLHVSLFGEAP